MLIIFAICCCIHTVFAAKVQSPIVDVVLNDIQLHNYASDIMPILDLKLVPWQGRNAINGSFLFAKFVPKMQMQLIVSFIKPDKTRLNMVDSSADACELLDGAYSKQTIPKLVLGLLDKQKKFPKKCPIGVNKTYELEYFYMETPKFPLPNLKFLVVVAAFTANKERKIFEFSVKGATKRYRN